MNIIIIRRGPYTWIISEYWLIAVGGIISFIFTSFIIVVSHLIYKQLTKKKQPKILKSANTESNSPQNPNLNIYRGGDNNIENCFPEPGIYLVVDDLLKKSIQKLVNRKGKLTVVSVSVALFAFAIKDNLGPIIWNYGLEIYFSNLKETVTRILFFIIMMSSLAVSITSYALALYGILPALSVSGISLAVSTAFAVLVINTMAIKLITALDCNQFVQKLPEIKSLPYIKQEDLRRDKVFIKTERDDELELLVLQPSKPDETCTHEVIQEFDTSGITSIDEAQPIVKIKTTCSSNVKERKFVPLKERTKTLSDLIRENDINNFEKSASAIDNYEKMRQNPTQRYQNQRQKIKENRDNNNNK
jgi:hypothetical protein